METDHRRLPGTSIPKVGLLSTSGAPDHTYSDPSSLQAPGCSQQSLLESLSSSVAEATGHRQHSLFTAGLQISRSDSGHTADDNVDWDITNGGSFHTPLTASYHNHWTLKKSIRMQK